MVAAATLEVGCAAATSRPYRCACVQFTVGRGETGG